MRESEQRPIIGPGPPLVQPLTKIGFRDPPPRSVTHSIQHVTETAVLASEIEQLPDRTGYLKFASQPSWMKVEFPVFELPRVAKPFVPG